MTLGTSFHRYTRHWRFCFLVALPPCGICCFAPNICSSLPCGDHPSRGLKDEQWPPLQPSPAVRSTIPSGHRARLHGGEKRHTRTRVLLRLDFRFVQSDCPDGHLSLVVNSSNPPLSPCPRRGHSGNCPCRGIGPGRAKDARPCDGSENEFKWGVKSAKLIWMCRRRRVGRLNGGDDITARWRLN